MVGEKRQIAHKWRISVAFDARIWLYVRLCCDADGPNRDWAGLSQHFGLSDTNELTLGEYFYDIDHHT
jgi:hypothetical protein